MLKKRDEQNEELLECKGIATVVVTSQTSTLYVLKKKLQLIFCHPLALACLASWQLSNLPGLAGTKSRNNIWPISTKRAERLQDSTEELE